MAYFDKLMESVSFLMIVVIVLLFAFFVHILLILFTRFEKTITVESNLAYGGNRSIGNVISDKEGNIYKIRNVTLLLHFRAAELQAMLKPGETFKVKGFGVRVPFLGMYPTIYDVEK
jgi:hypothetical protein